MINNNPENNSSGEFNSEANGPVNEANSSQTNSNRKYAESFDEDTNLKANAINGSESEDVSGAGKSPSIFSKVKDKVSQISGNEKLGKVKDVGRKGLGPIVEVLHRHSGDINPYIEAIGRALKAGVDSLNQQDASEADRMVSGWFGEASQWFEDLKTRFDSTSGTDLMTYLEEEGRRRPGFMFAISYVAGLGFGRMGRHLGQRKVNETQNPSTTMH